MRRIVAACIVLLAIAVLCIWEMSAISDTCNMTDAYVRKITEAVNRGDFHAAAGNFEKLKNEWNEKQNTLNIFIPHTDSGKIRIEFLHLERFIKSKNKEETLLCIGELTDELKTIESRIDVCFSNIL